MAASKDPAAKLAEAPPEEHVRLSEPVCPAEWTVQQRLVAIVADLPALGKTDYNEQQRFHFRSHDTVLNALNPLLARYGVLVVPRVLERVTSERTTGNNKTMYEVNLHVQYTFFGAGGDSLVASCWGEGTDMGDKSTNKAMTMAMKNVLAQVFAVSTAETVDTDSQTPEETTRASAPPGRSQPAAPPAAPSPPPGPTTADLIEQLKRYTGGPEPFIREAVEKKHGIVFPDKFGDLPADIKIDTFKRLVEVVALLETDEAEHGHDPLKMPAVDLHSWLAVAFTEVWDVPVAGPDDFHPPIPFAG